MLVFLIFLNFKYWRAPGFIRSRRFSIYTPSLGDSYTDSWLKKYIYAESSHIYVPSSLTLQVQTRKFKCLLGTSKHLKLKMAQTEISFSTPPPNLFSPSQQYIIISNYLTRYLIISNYIHDHFCLWTIYHQALAIENYTSHFFTYLQNIPQWLLSWLGIQSEV